MASIAAVLAAQKLHPSRTVVLVPYAQLMQRAREAWAAHTARQGTAAFVPRFESTMNWATAQAQASGGFVAAADDLQLDAAVDMLTAASLLTRAGLGTQSALAGRLVEAASALARLAAAQLPDQRADWGMQLAAQLAALPGGGAQSAVALENAVARLAVVWASTSSYPTDVLFDAAPDWLVVIDGLQAEPLAEALKTRFAGRVTTIAFPALNPAANPTVHAAQDAEDEAQLSAACVLAHLAQGRNPVALIAQDRSLVRRVRAMLAETGVLLRDETGWTLSTTRAAATLLSLLNALPWDAPTDAVLDWLKNAPAFDRSAVDAFEQDARRAGVRFWHSLPAGLLEAHPVCAALGPLRDALQRSRPLAQWLADVQRALVASGQWAPLASDDAGAAVLAALRLCEPGTPLSPLISTSPAVSDLAFTKLAASVRMGLSDVTGWVMQTLEAASFQPPHPPVLLQGTAQTLGQVVILPLSQLLGRPMQAVVMPGCDDVRLAVSPEPPGAWTPAQRAVLGLVTRSDLAASAQAAWQCALGMPHLDLLWRQSEAGESMMRSGFVQSLLWQAPEPAAPVPDPRISRAVPLAPTPRPLPVGASLPVQRLSASAYEDLRRCPYRFFALRQLKLQDSNELETELGKRDFGNWLHTLLHRFHEALKTAVEQKNASNSALVTVFINKFAMINIAASEAAAELNLTAAEFLPFAASWPQVRDAYLEWLDGHDASGHQYAEGEVWKDMAYGDVTLFGKLDRIDQTASGQRLVMDYKTEPRSTTDARIKSGPEDTQLAFYAALLADDTLAAAYINLGEKGGTKTVPQPDVVGLRDALVASLISDTTRIAAGAPLPALGEGKACDYCAARGLCRRDFW